MPRVGKNIYKRKDGRWEGRYIKAHENGRAKYKSVYGHSYKELSAKLSAAKADVYKKASTVKAGTVDTIAKEWLDEASATLKESSINKYEDLINRYIIPYFKNDDFTDITNEKLISFSNNLHVRGGTYKQGLSSSTVNQIISIMNSLYVYALRHNITVNYNTECLNIKTDKKEIRVLSVNEEENLIGYLCENYNLISLGILLCLFTGLRVGELCALSWDDFDFISGNIRITKNMQRVRIKDNPNRKTEIKILAPKSACSVRTIPIPSNLKAQLLHEYVKGAFILSGNDKKYVAPRLMQYQFQKALKQAGIHNVNFHALRHTFATRSIEHGVDVKCLSEILGHASVSITLNRYVHPSMALKSDNLAKLTNHFPIDL